MKNVTWFSNVYGKYKIFSFLNVILGCLSFLGIFALFTGTAKNKSEIIISICMFLGGMILLILRNKKHLTLILSILICFLQVILGMIAVFFLAACAVFGISGNSNKSKNTQTVYTPNQNSNAAKESWKNDIYNDTLAKQYGYDNVQSAINAGIDVNGNKL